jgi:hypothetical protein
VCSAGTADCFDGSEFYCGAPEPEEPQIVGGPITIACDDGTNVVCSAGTADCFDGSEFYCGAPEPEVVSIPEPVVELEVEVTEPEPTPEVEEE